MSNPLLDLAPVTAGEFNRVGEAAQRLLRTEHDVLIFPGEAIVPLEAAARSAGGPGVHALNVVTSPYGRYFGDWLRDSGATVVEIATSPGDVVDPGAVARALEAHPEISIVSFVHAEAISGVRNDARALCDVARAHGALVILDAVASFGAEDLPIDTWGVDVVVVGPQKALAGPLGVSLISVSDRAWETFARNERAPRHSFLSLLDWKSSWIDTDRTALPVLLSPLENVALGAAIERVNEEGLDRVIARHRAAAAAARAGGRALGLEPFSRDVHAASIVTTFYSPPGHDARALVRSALREGDVALSSGFGELSSRVIRVDHTGQRAQLGVVLGAIEALARALGADSLSDAALTRAESSWHETLDAAQ